MLLCSLVTSPADVTSEEDTMKLSNIPEKPLPPSAEQLQQINAWRDELRGVHVACRQARDSNDLDAPAVLALLKEHRLVGALVEASETKWQRTAAADIMQRLAEAAAQHRVLWMRRDMASLHRFIESHVMRQAAYHAGETKKGEQEDGR